MLRAVDGCRRNLGDRSLDGRRGHWWYRRLALRWFNPSQRERAYGRDVESNALYEFCEFSIGLSANSRKCGVGRGLMFIRQDYLSLGGNSAR